MGHSSSRRFSLTVILLLALLVLLVAACLVFGSVDIDASAVMSIVMGNESDNEAWNIIVL